MSCCVGHFRFGHFCNAAFQAGHWHFSGSLVLFWCPGCLGGSAFILSRVRNSMLEKLDTGISCRKGELPFPSQVFKISSKLCFMGIRG